MHLEVVPLLQECLDLFVGSSLSLSPALLQGLHLGLGLRLCLCPPLLPQPALQSAAHLASPPQVVLQVLATCNLGHIMLFVVKKIHAKLAAGNLGHIMLFDAKKIHAELAACSPGHITLQTTYMPTFSVAEPYQRPRKVHLLSVCLGRYATATDLFLPIWRHCTKTHATASSLQHAVGASLEQHYTPVAQGSSF